MYLSVDDPMERGAVPERCACHVPECGRSRPERLAVCSYHWRRIPTPARRLLMRHHRAAPHVRQALAGLAVSAIAISRRQRHPARVLRETLAALPAALERDARVALSQLLPVD